MAKSNSILRELGVSGVREFTQLMIQYGYTRQWRYKRDRKAWRRWDAEEHDLRWCILCGRYLDPFAKVSAMYCSNSCRENARKKRRKRGVYPGYMRKGPVCIGLDLDLRELKDRRFDAFYLCHGKTIEHAPTICKRWRQEFVVEELD